MMAGELRRILPLMALRGAALGAQLAVQLVVGALAGAAALGLLQICQTWTALLGEVFGRGAPLQAMRTYAAGRRTEREQLAFLARAASRSLTIGLIVGAPTVLFVALLHDAPWAWRMALILAVLFASLQALLRIATDALRGAGRPTVALVTDALVPSTALLVLFVVGPGREVDRLLLAYGGGLAAALLLAWRCLGVPLLRRTTCRRAPLEDDRNALWANAVLGMLFVGFPFFVWPSDDAAGAGAFAIAFKALNTVTTLLAVLASIHGPRFARAWAASRHDTLRQELRRSAQLSLLAFLPIVVLLLLASPSLSRWLGEGFAALPGFVAVLAAGQLFNAATGLPGLLLGLCGQGRIEAWINTVALATAFAIAIATKPEPLALAWLYAGLVAGKNLASWWAARRFLTALTHPVAPSPLTGVQS